MMRTQEQLDAWLKAALYKIDTMPRDELIEALERAGLVELEENNDETN